MTLAEIKAQAEKVQDFKEQIGYFALDVTSQVLNTLTRDDRGHYDLSSFNATDASNTFRNAYKSILRQDLGMRRELDDFEVDGLIQAKYGVPLSGIENLFRDEGAESMKYLEQNFIPSAGDDWLKSNLQSLTARVDKTMQNDLFQAVGQPLNENMSDAHYNEVARKYLANEPISRQTLRSSDYWSN